MAGFALGRVLCSLLFLFSGIVFAVLNVNETTSQIILENDRLHVALNKSTAVIDGLTLDHQDLLGALSYEKPTPGGATGSGNSGIGPYLDCYCTPQGFYTPGTIAPEFRIFKGTDSDKAQYAGVVMSETYPATGQLLEFYYFIREGETGLHTFSRLAYYNETTPFLRNLQEFRTLFRPNTPIWTHLSTNDKTYAPMPSKDATAYQITVQDATWYLANTTQDPYVEQMADYFTKYTFQDEWREHKVHGMYSDGTTSPGNLTYGAWVVLNTVDTYFNGPTNSDLMVDGIVYNYIVSNHHGNGTPNITHGFDRTFGPTYYHFNSGTPGTSLAKLRQDAARYADPQWNVRFYDEIAKHVPKYVPTGGRGLWRGAITLPKTSNWSRPIAVLTKEGLDFQDNAQDNKAYQYWAELKAVGDSNVAVAEIPRVKAGRYRLTVYADGLFGQYEQDGIVVKPGKATATEAEFSEESAGKELWRIGTPDRSSGEYRHGVEPDPTHPLHPEQYRIYWAVYDFPTEFPSGVRFRVGESKEAVDFNYVHWSSFGGKGNSIRSTPFVSPTVNNWTIAFDAAPAELLRSTSNGTNEATFTVQLAGAKTAAGNTDAYNATEPYSNLPYVVTVNGHELEPWVIPYYHSSSCAVRSAVSCYNIAHKFVFPSSWLKAADNEIVLRLPADAMDYESAQLPQQVYVQYDALRLEVR
ncbi:polysaccharide lyase family 4 protein [Aplosporella prunicola CBS 121167]|uniref:Polysaccharide lyase family 4 protein n=1 Tax=Aplosporella prunicola CBS 121167 TaxID=1176127 RepID=A0A6A6AZF0_9PEZI|nr:polysaccharide lyase family 4 protein [Aplosporella prunicola CBS 121167]KAF2136384.1 polysaccharide lyase family 4 protein [Aplosporella prunicola CBS 121167]